MRIVQLTTVHRWDDVRIYHKISRTLADAGHDVHMVAPAPGAGERPDPGHITMHWLPPSGSRPARLLNAWRAVGAVRRARPDVGHFHDPELMPTALLLLDSSTLPTGQRATGQRATNCDRMWRRLNRSRIVSL